MMEDNRNTNKTRKQRDRIGIILYGAYIVMLVASVFLIVKLAGIQLFFHPDENIAHKLTQKVSEQKLTPTRGNILARDGRMLALTIPRYQLVMDCTVRKADFAEMDPQDRKEAEEKWLGKARDFSEDIAVIFPQKSASEYYEAITQGRKSGRKYLKIGGPVDWNVYSRIRELPMFKMGRNRSGLWVETESVRRYPYDKLGRRTIGFIRNNRSEVGNRLVGLEGRFDKELRGTEGSMWMKGTDAGMVRDYDSTFTKAVDGLDLRTTLDIDFQDVADRALREQIAASDHSDDIEGGCVVLMDVKTGAIRAMVNLLRDSSNGGSLEEISNLAIGRLGNPGSVFKSTTIISALEDGYLKSLDETMPSNGGRTPGFKEVDQHILDYEREHHTKEVPVLYGLQVSSNYVFRQIAIKNYSSQPEKFLAHLDAYKLTDSFDFDLEGLAKPDIVRPGTSSWSGTALGSIAIGYSVTETPLHILTFYNAIANGGKMMKPYLVESIEKDGQIVRKLGPSILNERICSKESADTLTRGLATVTTVGTAAYRLKNARCSVAGKTGTARVLLDNGAFFTADGKKKNQGTFVGFFPVEEPRYSVICTIYSKPSKANFYGGTIPAQVTRDLVDAICNLDPYWQKELSGSERRGAPKMDVNLTFSPVIEGESIEVPDFRNLGIKDALYLAGNSGLDCRYSGTGHVKSQVPRAGTAAKKGETVTLVLR